MGSLTFIFSLPLFEMRLLLNLSDQERVACGLPGGNSRGCECRSVMVVHTKAPTLVLYSPSQPEEHFGAFISSHRDPDTWNLHHGKSCVRKCFFFLNKQKNEQQSIKVEKFELKSECSVIRAATQ